MELDFSAQIRAANENKTLNKPFRTPNGPKKFSVYAKNDKGNVVKVNFGDKNMEIKRDDPERRKSFRARHQCDTNRGPKWKARWWACSLWADKPVSKMVSSKASVNDSMEEWDGETFWEETELLRANPLLSKAELSTEDNEVFVPFFV
jgi:hypothetical protein